MFSVVALGRFCMASPTTTIVSNEYPVNYEQWVSFNLIMAVLHGPNITSWSLQVFPIFSKADFEWWVVRGVVRLQTCRKHSQSSEHTPPPTYLKLVRNGWVTKKLEQNCDFSYFFQSTVRLYTRVWGMLAPILWIHGNSKVFSRLFHLVLLWFPQSPTV